MTICWRCWYWKLYSASLLAMAGALAVGAGLFPIAGSGDVALAQITPDGTLGAESSVVTPDVINALPSDRIDGGAVRGANLFHSFQEFNVAQGRGAYFTNPVGISNILSRVTGVNASNILGKLGVLGHANLFLINPNGIIFERNASLDVGGSFIGSTASAVNFADGTQFSATAHPTTPLLSVNVPIGLQFGGNPGKILVQGDGQGTRTTPELIDTTVGMRVQPNQTLAMVGGDVALSGGTLKTAGGRIELGSVTGPGLVSLNPTTFGWALGYEGVSTFGDIHLSQQAAVDASGAGGGDIQVRGRRVTLTNGSQIEASTLRAEPGGTLTVTALESVEAIGFSADDQFPSGLFTQVYPGATGAGGNINITAGSLSLTNGAALGASTRGQGDAGSVNIHAGSTVSFAGVGSNGLSGVAFTTVTPEAVGDGGDINITTGSLSMSNGANLAASTRGQGNAGSVNINAGSTVSFDGVSRNGLPSGAFSTVEPGAEGNGGGINITTGLLSVTNGAELVATTSGEGNAGNILVNATDFIELSGVAPFPRLENGKPGGFSSGLFTATEEGASGQGGEINVTTNTLRLSDGAVLSARSRSAFRGGNITVDANVLEVTGGGQLLTTAFSSGDAGNITIKVTQSITISGSDPTLFDRFNSVAEVFGEKQAEFTIDPIGPASGLFASTSENSIGQGGDLKITTGQLIVRDGAEVNVGNEGSGNAGNLEVMARSIYVYNQGKLRAETASGQGGNITLKDLDLLLLRDNSEISTTAGTVGTSGDGGDITIDTDLLVALENSDITANAVEGQGGNVQINTQGLFFSPDSQITASSQRGIDGVVEINRSDVDPSQGLATLPAELVDASGLIASGCAALGENEFIVTGRGGLPPSPSDTLSSDTVWSDLRYRTQFAETRTIFEDATQETNSTPQQLVEAQGWVINNLGKVVLTATAPNVTRPIPWMPSVDCHMP